MPSAARAPRTSYRHGVRPIFDEWGQPGRHRHSTGQVGLRQGQPVQHFNSKVDFAIAFLDRREAVWTRGWLETEIKRRATSPKLGCWQFSTSSTAGFRRNPLRAVLSSTCCWSLKQTVPVHHAATIHLAKIRAIVRGLAEEAGLREPEKFAQAWHMLMKGSIVSAGEGNRNAALEAKCAARLVLKGWKRRS